MFSSGKIVDYTFSPDKNRVEKCISNPIFCIPNTSVILEFTYTNLDIQGVNSLLMTNDSKKHVKLNFKFQR